VGGELGGFLEPSGGSKGSSGVPRLGFPSSLGPQSGVKLNLIGILTMSCRFSRDPKLTLAIIGLIALSRVSSPNSQPITSGNGFVTHEPKSCG
jgi:hypothetical protein